MVNLDKFYTKPEIARQCVHYLQECITITDDDILLEPSAGCGNFLQALADYNVIAYDLVPEGDNIIQQDFLKLESEYGDYITIGNPPFGKRSKLAIQFFNKAATMSKVIAFIIPNTFAKWSVQKNLAPGWKLIKTFNLPSNSFTDNGKDFQVNCLFQIWVREDQPGEDCRLQYSPAISCDDFECWQYNATQQAKKYVYITAPYLNESNNSCVRFRVPSCDKLINSPSLKTFTASTNALLFFPLSVSTGIDPMPTFYTILPLK